MKEIIRTAVLEQDYFDSGTQRLVLKDTKLVQYVGETTWRYRGPDKKFYEAAMINAPMKVEDFYDLKFKPGGHLPVED
jgi:hypothetical protein